MKSAQLKARLFALAACLAVTLTAAEKSPLRSELAGFSRGVNFGNFLEVPPGATWSEPHGAEDVAQIKKEGFDHIRMPIGWHHYSGPAPEFKLNGEIFAKVDFMVTNAVAHGLSIILNIQHFDDFTTDPAPETGKFIAIWKQIAEHYKDSSSRVAFELLNEPKDAATTEVMNGIYARAISEIRKTNPRRKIFVGPGRWNSLDEVEKLRLPKEDRNLIVTVHCYDPFLFTHQGASWTMPTTATTGIKYPGPPEESIQPDQRVKEAGHIQWIANYNNLPRPENPSSAKAFRQRMEKMAAWGKAEDRPIHLGEFGAYTRADHASRIRYYTEMRKTAEELGFGWAIWDWKAGFRYWDKNQPVEGMPEALFGK